MSFTTPSMEMNLYKVEIVHDINLFKDGDLYIPPNYNDSPFMHPEIFPSTRVGRWNTRPHLENYVELDYGEYYKIKLFNYTWDRCVARVLINEKPIGEWKISPRSNITIDKTLDVVSKGSNLKVGDIGDTCNIIGLSKGWSMVNCGDKLRFTKYGTQSDLITVYFQREKWTENSIDNLMNGECKPIPIWSVDSSKETIIYVRLVGKRRYNPYDSVVSLRADCPSYIS